MRFEAPEDLLPPAHPARVLWDVVGTLDLRPFLADAKSVEGSAGRDVLSPRMLLTLWLFAITQGISSARRSRGAPSPTGPSAGSSAISP